MSEDDHFQWYVVIMLALIAGMLVVIIVTQ